MTLGFIGTGTIAAAIVDGMRAAKDDRPVILSPRNPDVAAALAPRHANVSNAATNQAVLDA